MGGLAVVMTWKETPAGMAGMSASCTSSLGVGHSASSFHFLGDTPPRPLF